MIGSSPSTRTGASLLCAAGRPAGYRLEIGGDFSGAIGYTWGMDGKLASLALTNAAGRTLSAALGEDYDANGNVTAYRTETRGYAAQYAYDAFGNTVSSSGPMAGFFPHRFSTKYYFSKGTVKPKY